MLKSIDGRVEVSGSKNQIIADFGCVIKALLQMEVVDDKLIEWLINNAKKSDEELTADLEKEKAKKEADLLKNMKVLKHMKEMLDEDDPFLTGVLELLDKHL